MIKSIICLQLIFICLFVYCACEMIMSLKKTAKVYHQCIIDNHNEMANYKEYCNSKRWLQ